jgi:hypothetical protein
MPNGEITPVENKCFNVVRCIQVTDKDTLYVIAKLLGINAKKAKKMQVGNVYIVQDCDPSQPAKRRACNPRTTLVTPADTERAGKRAAGYR